MLEAQLVSLMPLDFALLFLVAAPAWVAARRFDRMRGLGGSALKLLSDALTGLLAGWVTVAIAISTAPLLRWAFDLGASDRPWLMLWAALAVAAGGAWLASARFTRSLWYFAALLWGVGGIVVNNFQRTEYGFLAWAALLAAIVIAFARMTRGARGAVV